MDGDYCPIYKSSLTPGSKCVLYYAHIKEQLILFGKKLPTYDGTGVN